MNMVLICPVYSWLCIWSSPVPIVQYYQKCPNSFNRFLSNYFCVEWLVNPNDPSYGSKHQRCLHEECISWICQELCLVDWIRSIIKGNRCGVSHLADERVKFICRVYWRVCVRKREREREGESVSDSGCVCECVWGEEQRASPMSQTPTLHNIAGMAENALALSLGIIKESPCTPTNERQAIHSHALRN